MSAMTSQVTRVSILYSTVCSGADKKSQSSASPAFVRGIHRWPLNSSHKGSVTRKMFPIVTSSWDEITVKNNWTFLLEISIIFTDQLYCTTINWIYKRVEILAFRSFPIILALYHGFPDCCRLGDIVVVYHGDCESQGTAPDTYWRLGEIYRYVTYCKWHSIK